MSTPRQRVARGNGARVPLPPPPPADVPLENTFDWQQPVIMTSIPAVLIALYALVMGRQEVWLIALAAALVWAMYALNVWLKTRAYLQIDSDDVLHARRFFGTHSVPGGEVVRVKEIVNGRSPDVLLVTRGGKRVAVPSSRLRGGHSVLFTWLLRHHPDVEMDRGCERIVTTLEDRGLL